jgi:hypothetical protein
MQLPSPPTVALMTANSHNLHAGSGYHVWRGVEESRRGRRTQRHPRAVLAAHQRPAGASPAARRTTAPLTSPRTSSPRPDPSSPPRRPAVGTTTTTGPSRTTRRSTDCLRPPSPCVRARVQRGSGDGGPSVHPCCFVPLRVQLHEQDELIWNDGVAPETAIDFDVPHFSAWEGLLGWLGGFGFFYGVWLYAKSTDHPANKLTVRGQGRGLHCQGRPSRVGGASSAVALPSMSLCCCRPRATCRSTPRRRPWATGGTASIDGRRSTARRWRVVGDTLHRPPSAH